MAVVRPAAIPPLSVAADDADGTYEVSWGSVPHASRYTLQESLTGASWTTVQDTGQTHISYRGKSNRSYYYRVRACNGLGCTAFSGTRRIDVARAPGVPESISVPTLHGSGDFTVSWGEASGDLSFYDLDQHPSTNIYDGSNRSHPINGKGVGQYRYQVRACKTVGSYTHCSGWRVSDTVTLAIPATPVLSAPSHDEDGNYRLSWSPVSNSTHYVFEERVGLGAWAPVTSVTGTRYDAVNKAFNVYQYRVRACNALGCSADTVRDVVVSPEVPAWAQSLTAPVADHVPTAFTLHDHDASVGAIAGNGGVSGGQASYSMPVSLPPGRAGMQPSVAIQYSSQGGNSALGMGFSLSATSSIGRCGATIIHDGIRRAVTYDASHDRLCFNGQRLLVENGVAYGRDGAVYRTELDSFSRITQHGDINGATTRFTVELKNGRIQFYGASADSRVVPAGAPVPQRWLLSREEDRTQNRNFIHYAYQDYGHGEVLLQRIRYTGRGDTDGDRQVVFDYEERPDVTSSYQAGGLQAQTQRLRSLSTYYQQQTVKTLHFTYKSSVSSQRSLLAKVEECGYNRDGARHCLAPTRFSWLDRAHDYVLEPLGYKADASSAITPVSTATRVQPLLPRGDSDGDGTPNWPNWYIDAEGVGGTAPALASTCHRSSIGLKYQCMTADFNLDGLSDSWAWNSAGALTLTLASHNGSGTTITTRLTAARERSIDMMADFNGDNWPDILYSEDPDDAVGSGPVRVYLALHSGNPNAPYPTQQWVLDHGQEQLSPLQYTSVTSSSVLGDMDGNGMPDIVVYNNQLPVVAHGWQENQHPIPEKILFSEVDSAGNVSFVEHDIRAHLALVPGYGANDVNTYFFHTFLDVNGDGLSDWLSWAGNSRRLWLSINRGGRQFAPWQDLGDDALLPARSSLYNLVRTDEAEQGNVFYPRYGHALMPHDIDADGRMELLTPDALLAPICVRYRHRHGEQFVCGEDIYDPINAPDGVGQHTFSVAAVDDNVFRYAALRFEETAPGRYRMVKTPTGIVASASQKSGLDAFGNGLSDVVFTLGARFGSSYFERQQGVTAGLSTGAYINRNRGAATDGDRYQPSDMLSGVVNGVGERHDWVYRPMASRDSRYHSQGEPFYSPDFDYLDGLSASAQQAHLHFTSSMYVVAEHRRSNGLGEQMNAMRYRYKGAMLNREGRGFQGFRSIIVDDLAQGLRRRDDYHQVFPLAGRHYRTRQWAITDAANDSALDRVSALTETSYQWVFWPNSAKDGVHHTTVDAPTDSWTLPRHQRVFVGLSGETRIERTLDAASRTERFRQTSTRDFDVWGNPLKITTSYQEPGGQHVITSEISTTYRADESTWWLTRMDAQVTTRLPIVSRVHATASASVAANDPQHQVTVTYREWDAQARQPGRVSTEPSTGKAVTVTTAYNNDGLPTSVTTSSAGETDRRVSTTYSEDGYFPRTVTNALGHTVETHTDARFGTPLWVADANGQRTSTQYDVFGRATATTVDGITPPALTSLQWCTSCGVANAQFRIIREQEGRPRQFVYVDTLGRTVRTETEALDGTGRIVQVRQYNARGLMTFDSVPAFDRASDSGTRYEDFDLLGRPGHKTVSQTDGQQLDVRYRYEQGARHFTTELVANGLSMSRTHNGLGQLIETVDANNGVTAYAYDSSGNPIVMQDANGNAITASYNALGQKLWVDDPNMGRKTFAYTGFGEVHRETDANNDVREYRYDVLGRQTKRFVNGTEEASWSYDSAANGLGLLAGESRSNAAFSKSYRYDSLSRLDQVTTTIDGEAFVTATQYDGYFGRVKGMQYPTGLTVAYGYNDRGYQTTVSNAATNYVYRETSNTDAYGQWQQAQLGMGTASVTRHYYGETGQFQDFEVRNATGLLHEQDYETYDSFGNLTRTSVNVPSLSPARAQEDYVYDNLHRLDRYTRSEGATVAYAVDYEYDAVGNLTLKDDYANVYHYTGPKPNAVNKVDLTSGGSVTFGYDNNGNRTHENGVETLRYNSYNKPTRVTRHGTRLDFFYGVDDMRYKQVNVTQNTTTVYVDKLFEKITEGNTVKHRIFIDDIAVLTTELSNGVASNYQIGFTHRDRLGSGVVITDHLGVLKETHSFDPFGKPKAGNLQVKSLAILDSHLTTRGFTDHEHLDDVQLIHMNGRGYDYNLGRFLSVDPIIQAPGNSQSLNPYSYIMNNPLSGTDPTGYCSASRLQGACDNTPSVWGGSAGNGLGALSSLNNRPQVNHQALSTFSGDAVMDEVLTNTGDVGKLADRGNVGNAAGVDNGNITAANSSVATAAPTSVTGGVVEEVIVTGARSLGKRLASTPWGAVIAGLILPTQMAGPESTETNSMPNMRGAEGGMVSSGSPGGLEPDDDPNNNDGTFLRDSRTIKFSQNNINGSFDGGGKVTALIARLRNQPGYSNQIEPIRLVRFKDLPSGVRANLARQGVGRDTVFTLDNRRLYAARLARVNVRARWATSSDLSGINLARRFSTTTGGRLPKIR
ncbi:RHS repeat-associated core domain-containing protein [Agarilytica rhodophyticola]|uniref:RHS repeat-associated core domain-containing protein n=1 Tax=Agarilytica rhodophyticola TaxID=1737490 RepID=UPI00131A4247|nr:RHS repeat-associated core domain-containing protein [Agarilytica rhodophyticola]